MTTHAETPREEVLGGRYDMSQEELQQSAELFLQENPPRENSGRFACYRIEGDSQFADIGRTIEGTVFMDAFGNDAETMRTAYGPYEQASTFFVNFDMETRRPVGVLRAIKNSPAGLMTLNDLSGGERMSDAKTGRPVSVTKESIMQFHGIDSLDSCWDIGTVAVVPEYRASKGGQQLTSVQLYRAAYLSAVEAGIEHLVSVVDTAPLAQMTRFLGIPFRPLANLAEVTYLDSPKSQPVYGHVPSFYPEMSKHRKTARGRMAGPLLDRLMDGKAGMDESLQFLTPEQSAELRRRGRTGEQGRRSMGRKLISLVRGR